MKMKKIAAALLAALMLATAATPVYAEDMVVQNETVAIEDESKMSNDELFEQYFIQRTLESFGVSTFVVDYWRDVFNDMEYKIFDTLRKRVAAIAENGGKSTISISASELGIAGASFSNISWDDIYKIVDALRADCPFHLYWYDKTVSTSYSKSSSTLKIVFRVAQGYQAEGYNANDPEVTKDVSLVNTATSNAIRIVSRYSDTSISDMYRLYAFKEEICALVDYNYDALDPSTPYGDPWQLIYVFDGDSNTKVVCEGYAKAFKYLCDLAEAAGHFDDNNFACYIVTGDTGGGHMWNLVYLNNITYMVDVTNTDGGWGGMLFMNSKSNGDISPNSYKIEYIIYQNNNSITYTYDDETIALYNSETIQLSGNTVYSLQISGLPQVENERTTLTLYHNSVKQAITSTDTWTTGFAAFAAGYYQIEIAHKGYATRTYGVYFGEIDVLELKDPYNLQPLHLLGDLDGNGQVDATDIAAVLAHLRGESEKKLTGYAYTCADYDQNGTVNARDVVLMLHALKG